MTPERSQRYGGLVHAITEQAASHTNSGLPADAAAKVIAKAVTARKPRTRYTVGRDAALITRLTRILPDRTLDRVLAAALRPHFPRRANESASLPRRRCRYHRKASALAERDAAVTLGAERDGSVTLGVDFRNPEGRWDLLMSARVSDRVQFQPRDPLKIVGAACVKRDAVSDCTGCD